MLMCRCGHPESNHEHYRAGSDCSQCSCTRFRRKWWFLKWDYERNR